MKWLNHYYNQLLELNFKTWVVSILVIWLPISNLAVQYVVNVLKGTTLVANIKDILIIGLIINLGLDIFLVIKNYLIAGKGSILPRLKSLILPCLPLILVLFLNILALGSSFIFNRVSLKTFLIGYYFELFWLDLLAIWLTWSNLKSFLPKSQPALIPNFDWSVIIRSISIGFLLVSLVSLFSIGFGQAETLKNFGYGQASTGGLVSSNNPCHNVDYGIATCRLMGSFGHPLHFVGYLLLVLAIFINQAIITRGWYSRLFYLALVSCNLFFIYFSHTRFAIFGLVLTLTWLIFGLIGGYLNREYLFFGKVIKLLTSKVALIFVLSIILLTTLFVVNIDINTQFPSLASNLPTSLTKPSSSAWHIRQTQSNLQVIQDSPNKLFIGFGVGMAGSTARPKYQDIENNPIYQKILLQGRFYPDMIQEFIMIPDNWFIQTTLNGGLIYTLVYLLLLLYPLRYVFNLFKESCWDTRSITFGFLVCGLLAILVGSLIQQLFESQVTTFFFIVISVIVSRPQKPSPSVKLIS